MRGRRRGCLSGVLGREGDLQACSSTSKVTPENQHGGGGVKSPELCSHWSQPELGREPGRELGKWGPPWAERGAGQESRVGVERLGLHCVISPQILSDLACFVPVLIIF